MKHMKIKENFDLIYDEIKQNLKLKLTKKQLFIRCLFSYSMLCATMFDNCQNANANSYQF